MKIRYKNLLNIFVPGAIFLLIFTSTIAFFTKANISIEISKILQNDAKVTAEYFDLFFYEKRSQLTGFTYIDYIKDCMETLSTEEGTSCSQSKLSDYLSDTILFASVDSLEVSLIDSHGVVRASTNKDKIDQDLNQDNIYKLGKDSFYISDIYESDMQAQLYLFDIAAPVIKNNKTVGVLTSSIMTEKLYEILSLGFENYKTSDRYIVNTEGLMSSPSRFIKKSILKQRVNSDGLRKCINDPNNGFNSNEILLYNDYRGVEVYGAYAYLPQVKWCLLTEIDKAEAATTFRSLISLFSTFSLLTIGLLFLAAWRLSYKISKPIIKLAHDIDILEKTDNFYKKIGTNSKDEIGHLSRTLDRILTKIHEIIDKRNKF